MYVLRSQRSIIFTLGRRGRIRTSYAFRKTETLGSSVQYLINERNET